MENRVCAATGYVIVHLSNHRGDDDPQGESVTLGQPKASRGGERKQLDSERPRRPRRRLLVLLHILIYAPMRA